MDGGSEWRGWKSGPRAPGGGLGLSSVGGGDIR